MYRFVGGGKQRNSLFAEYGSEKTVELKPLEWRGEIPGLLATTKTVRDDTCWFNESETQISDPFDRYDYMMQCFAEYVRGEKQNPYSLEYELELYRIILKCCGDV